MCGGAGGVDVDHVEEAEMLESIVALWKGVHLMASCYMFVLFVDIHCSSAHFMVCGIGLFVVQQQEMNIKKQTG